MVLCSASTLSGASVSGPALLVPPLAPRPGPPVVVSAVTSGSAALRTTLNTVDVGHCSLRRHGDCGRSAFIAVGVQRRRRALSHDPTQQEDLISSSHLLAFFFDSLCLSLQIHLQRAMLLRCLLVALSAVALSTLAAAQYTPAALADEITSLPGLDVQPSFRQFAGYLQVDAASNRSIFYCQTTHTRTLRNRRRGRISARDSPAFSLFFCFGDLFLVRLMQGTWSRRAALNRQIL